MSEAIVEVINVSKAFDKKIKVLENLNLSILPGTSCAIVGLSGEGKTTLLHLLAGIEKPDSGEIVSKHSAGLIFQSYNLLEDLSVLENLKMPLKIARKKINKEAIQTLLSLIEEVGLADKTHTLSCKLSGGEKQRVAIARAFVLDPPLILADEPTGNLDQVNSEKIHDLLLKFVKRRKKSLVIVTHDHNLANLCDQKFLLKRGHLKLSK